VALTTAFYFGPLAIPESKATYLIAIENSGFGPDASLGLNHHELTTTTSKPSPQKFEQAVADHGSGGGDGKIGQGEDIAQRPDDSPSNPNARALELSHQEVGIEQEDDEAYLDEGGPEIFLHSAQGLD
jgi:hypothetical protein